MGDFVDLGHDFPLRHFVELAVQFAILFQVIRDHGLVHQDHQAPFKLTGFAHLPLKNFLLLEELREHVCVLRSGHFFFAHVDAAEGILFGDHIIGVQICLHDFPEVLVNIDQVQVQGVEVTRCNHSQISRLLLVGTHIQFVHHEEPLEERKLRRRQAFFVDDGLCGLEEVVVVLLEDILLQRHPMNRSNRRVNVEAVVERHLAVVLVAQVA